MANYHNKGLKAISNDSDFNQGVNEGQEIGIGTSFSPVDNFEKDLTLLIETLVKTSIEEK